MTQLKYEELYHHGIKGQKWGVRRFQNEDGTRTAAGKKRERESNNREINTKKRSLSDKQKQEIKTVATIVGTAAVTSLAIYGAVKYSDAIKDRAYTLTVNKGYDALEKMKNENKLLEETFQSLDKIPTYYKDMVNDAQKYRIENAKRNIEKTAKDNSETFRSAYNTVKKNQGKKSAAELEEKHGTRTGILNNEEYQKSMKNAIGRYYDYEYDHDGSNRSLKVYNKGTLKDELQRRDKNRVK